MSGAPAAAAKVGQPVLVRDDAVERRARREMAGPADEAGHAVGAFPVRVLLAAERRGAGVGPGVVVRAVVGRILDDGVVGEAEVVDQLEQFADLHVVLDHAVAVFVLPGDAAMLRLHMGAEVHARGVPPAEERLAGLGLARDEVLGGGDGFIVNRLHALLGQRAGILDGLAALAVGLALEHAARAELLPERRVLRIVPVLRLLLGVEVIEAAEELVEAVHRRQMLVAVALVVLAELSGGVALALEDRGHGHVGLLPAFLRAGQTDLGHAGADGHAAADEGRATRRAALLRVVIGEGDAFFGDAIDVRRLVAHHAAAVVADVPGADVVAPDDEDVGFLVRRLNGGRDAKKRRASRQQ